MSSQLTVTAIDTLPMKPLSFDFAGKNEGVQELQVLARRREADRRRQREVPTRRLTRGYKQQLAADAAAKTRGYYQRLAAANLTPVKTVMTPAKMRRSRRLPQWRIDLIRMINFINTFSSYEPRVPVGDK